MNTWLRYVVLSLQAGPKLFVKPSSKSNRHIIINAISHCCLAGTVNNDIKNKVVEVSAVWQSGSHKARRTGSQSRVFNFT